MPFCANRGLGIPTLPRRGGGGAEWGGDACIALGGEPFSPNWMFSYFAHNSTASTTVSGTSGADISRQATTLRPHQRRKQVIFPSAPKQRPQRAPKAPPT